MQDLVVFQVVEDDACQHDVAREHAIAIFQFFVLSQGLDELTWVTEQFVRLGKFLFKVASLFLYFWSLIVYATYI